MEDKKTQNPETADNQEPKKEEFPEPEENWAHETVQELLDFWEEQGVYIRE